MPRILHSTDRNSKIGKPCQNYHPHFTVEHTKGHRGEMNWPNHMANKWARWSFINHSLIITQLPLSPSLHTHDRLY